MPSSSILQGMHESSKWRSQNLTMAEEHFAPLQRPEGQAGTARHVGLMLYRQALAEGFERPAGYLHIAWRGK